MPGGPVRAEYRAISADEYAKAEVYCRTAVELLWRQIGLHAVRGQGLVRLDALAGLPDDAPPALEASSHSGGLTAAVRRRRARLADLQVISRADAAVAPKRQRSGLAARDVPRLLEQESASAVAELAVCSDPATEPFTAKAIGGVRPLDLDEEPTER